MKLRETFTLTFLETPPEGFLTPLRLELGIRTFQIPELDEKRTSATAIVECPVNREELKVADGRQTLDGATSPKALEVAESSDLSAFVSQAVHLLSFLIDIPIRYAHCAHLDCLIPEGAADERHLDALGTRRIAHRLRAIVGMRTFSMSQISEHVLAVLAAKETGLALYAQALLLQESIAAFREFWKLLESAFGEQAEELVRCLADFEPAKELGFTLDELEALLTLRGRASHAASRAGIKEHRDVRNETVRLLPRLKCLVEQVIVTKRTWGAKALETDRVAPLLGYVGPDNSIVIFKRNVDSGVRSSDAGQVDARVRWHWGRARWPSS